MKVGKNMNKKWLSSPKAVKLDVSDKERIHSVISRSISVPSRLSQIVSRIEIKGGRIYLFRLHEQFGWDKPDVQFIKPLIEGRYAEFLLARITLFDKHGEKCEAGWQRHTGQWINLFKGDMIGCLVFIEENEQWFD